MSNTKDLKLYLILYNIIYLFIYFLFYLISLFSKNVKKNRKLFRGLNPEQIKKIESIRKENIPIVWFHASSVGEYEQAKALAMKYRERKPNKFIIISIFSISGYEQRKNDRFADLFFALPFDFFYRMKKLIQCICPEKVFYARYDLWPNMVYHLKKTNAKQYLISAQIKEKSLRLRFPFRKFFKKIYQNLEAIFSTDEINKKRLQPFNKNTIITGDTRFDAIQKKIENNPLPKDIKKSLLEIKNKKKKIFIAGSSYIRSERLLLKTFSKFNLFEKYHLILAPHHLEADHIKNIKDIIKDYNVSMVTLTERMNKVNIKNNESDITLIDRMGLLTALYQIADIAYVGGGFEGSVHTVIEPVFFGTPFITGPSIENSREAIDLKNQKLLIALQSDDPKEMVESILEIEKSHQFLKSELLKYFTERTGASERIFQAVEGFKK